MLFVVAACGSGGGDANGEVHADIIGTSPSTNTFIVQPEIIGLNQNFLNEPCYLPGHLIENH